MKCTVCNAVIVGQSSVCPWCGTALTVSEASDKPEASAPIVETPEPPAQQPIQVLKSPGYISFKPNISVFQTPTETQVEPAPQPVQEMPRLSAEPPLQTPPVHNELPTVESPIPQAPVEAPQPEAEPQDELQRMDAVIERALEMLRAEQFASYAEEAPDSAIPAEAAPAIQPLEAPVVAETGLQSAEAKLSSAVEGLKHLADRISTPATEKENTFFSFDTPDDAEAPAAPLAEPVAEPIVVEQPMETEPVAAEQPEEIEATAEPQEEAPEFEFTYQGDDVPTEAPPAPVEKPLMTTLSAPIAPRKQAKERKAPSTTDDGLTTIYALFMVLVACLPVLGLICTLIWAFKSNQDRAKTALGRALVVVNLLVMIILAAAVMYALMFLSENPGVSFSLFG